MKDLTLTPSRAVVTGSDLTIASSATTAAELAFLSGVTSAVQTQLNAKRSSTDGDLGAATLTNFRALVTAQTGTSYTILITDLASIITFNNASTITITVPSGLGAGFHCTCIQKGAGKLSFVASGTTLNNANSHTKTAGVKAMVTLVSDVANNFYFGGATGV